MEADAKKSEIAADRTSEFTCELKLLIMQRSRIYGKEIRGW